MTTKVVFESSGFWIYKRSGYDARGFNKKIMLPNAPNDLYLMADQAKISAALTGFIISLNQRRALMGINTDKGVSIIEVLDDHEPALGDTVAGPLHSLGCRRLHNVTQAIRFDALIQEIHGDFIRMRNILDDESPKSSPAQ